MSSIVEIAQAIEASALGSAIAESTVAFPVIEAIHLLGLAVSVGLLLLVDLRLLGVILPQVPAAAVHQQLRKWIITGFCVTFATGVLLFSAEAGQVIVNYAFIAHAILAILGIANALYFEIRLAPHAAQWTQSLPAAARLAGKLSLSAWFFVLVSGRLIPYLA